MIMAFVTVMEKVDRIVYSPEFIRLFSYEGKEDDEEAGEAAMTYEEQKLADESASAAETAAAAAAQLPGDHAAEGQQEGTSNPKKKRVNRGSVVMTTGEALQSLSGTIHAPTSPCWHSCCPAADLPSLRLSVAF